MNMRDGPDGRKCDSAAGDARACVGRKTEAAQTCLSMGMACELPVPCAMAVVVVDFVVFFNDLVPPCRAERCALRIRWA